MSYEQGFLDALKMVRYYIRKYNIQDAIIRKILDDLEEAVTEKRIERLKLELDII